MHTALGSRPLVYHSGYCPSKISFCLWICNTTLLIFIPLPCIYTHSTPHVFLSWNINYNSVSWAPDLCSDYLWNSQQWTTTRAQHICWSQVLFDHLNFCYGSITVTTFLNRLLNFSLFNLILLFQTSNHEEIHYKDSLIFYAHHHHITLVPYGSENQFVVSDILPQHLWNELMDIQWLKQLSQCLHVLH